MCVFLFAGAYEYFDLTYRASHLRQQLEADAAQQLMTLLPKIQGLILKGDWGEASRELGQQELLLPHTSTYLADRSGVILAQGVGSAAPGQEMLSGSFDSSQVSTRWLVKDQLLRVSIPITTGNGQEVLAYFIGVTDLGIQFQTLYHEQARHIAYLMLVLLILLCALLTAFLLLFVRPIQNLFQMAQAVRLGNPLEPFLDSPVLELHQIKLAFHEILDHLAGQQDSLEQLNHALEATVEERMSTLQRMYTSIQHHVDQLEAINALTASTAGLFEMQALAQSILDQTMQIFQADHGGLWIGDTMAAQNLPHSLRQAIGQVTETVVNDDWGAVSENDPLAPLASTLQGYGMAASVILPIQGPGETSGLLFLACSQPRRYDPEEVALLEIVVRHVQATAERIQSVNDIRTHNQRMQALVTQSGRLNQTFTVDEIIVKIGEGAFVLSKADRLAVFSIDETGQPGCLWSRNLTDEAIALILAHTKEAFATSEIDPPKPQFLHRLDFLEEKNPTRHMTQPIQSASIWPLVYENQASVFVGCYYDQPTRPTQNESELMEAFFRQAAAALENARLLEAESRQRQLAEALREIAAKLNSSLNLDEVLDSILNSLERVVPHDAAFLMRLEGEMIQPVRWRGLPDQYARQMESWCYTIHELDNRRRMVESIQGILIPDTRAEPSWVYTTGLEWVRSYAGAPICQQGEVTGFIDVMSSKPGFYGEAHGPILQAFADQAALALENARLYQNTQRRMDETRALYRAVQPLFHPVEDIHLLAEQITQAVTQEFSSAHCSILLVNETRTHLMLVAQAGSLTIMTPDLPLEGLGLTVQAVKTGNMVYSPDVTRDPNYVHGTDLTRSELVIPLQVRGEVIGILNLESPEIDAFDDRSQRLLASFAEQAALGLENARLYEAAHQRARELEALHTATTSLVTTLDQQKLLERILSSALSAIPAARAAALHLMDINGHLKVQIQHGIPQADGQEPGWIDTDGPWYRALRERQPLLIGGAESQKQAWFHLPENQSFASYLVAPLVQEEQALGVLTLMAPEPEAFSAPDLHLLISFASTATAAIHNAKLHSAVQYLAVTDPLTGVYNRRGFFELAQHLFDQAQTSNRAVSAVMIDIDFFKRVNDVYGHDIGDTVLRKLADRCKKVVRDSDTLCRYGGEEFAILLAETDLAGAEIAAHRLFHYVSSTPIETEVGPISVTISVGIAAKSEKCNTLHLLLKDADRALHKAKAEGRNQVQAWWDNEDQQPGAETN
jgi:diguanylate cyclase (GGDEF)-like protein